jgi:uncharacterized FAD-dependent dehydrogenase
MRAEAMRYILDSFKIKVSDIPANICDVDSILQNYIAGYINVKIGDIKKITIISKSIDARGAVPLLVYTVEFESTVPVSPLLAKPVAVPQKNETRYCQNHCTSLNQSQPLIVGAGPAGLMAAYILAAAGRKPIIFERGFDVERRSADIAAFRVTRELNSDSNYLFGEGGAGTFSDGKLYTRIRDTRSNFVLQTFIEGGAPAEISYLKRPHIGSDVLPVMVKNIREKIKQMGGVFHFGVTINDIMVDDSSCRGVITSKNEKFESGTVILAHGLGGRRLSETIIAHDIEYRLKGFQIGCRIEHTQAFIDRNQYKSPHRHSCLGAAEYNLVSRPPEHLDIPGVSTFCMCPGGEIVPATAFSGQLSTNGMSCYARDGVFANSCLIVTIPPELFVVPRTAINFLTEIEHNAFCAGGSDYTAPAQDAGAFVRGECRLSNKLSSYCFGLNAARIDKILPVPAAKAVASALIHFNKVMPGFISGKLIGVETFISSPIRFERNSENLQSSISGLFIAGEGAGSAGGIMSAAIDGIKIAEKILQQ